LNKAATAIFFSGYLLVARSAEALNASELVRKSKK
jgi:hypothetical protein